MVYKGGSQPELGLKFVQYEDGYFDEYAKGVCDSFFEMRRENDIKPYVCFPASQENREETLKNKDCNYVLFEDGKLIASVLVKGGYIDDLYVIPEYQGRGLGKKVVQFAINKALENKAEKIELGAVEWNTRAIKLYESLGFEIVQTVHSYRQFFDK
jgi:ribosomal protein S18 acetylase RimI-like enzyme